MEWTVVIGRVVLVESVLDHLVDKPAVDAFVEMWRFHSEQKESQERGETDDEPGHPFAFGERVFPSLDVIAEERKIR